MVYEKLYEMWASARLCACVCVSEHKVGWLTECQDMLLLLLLLLLGSNNKNVAHTHTHAHRERPVHVKILVVNRSRRRRRRRQQSRRAALVCSASRTCMCVCECVCGCGACVCMPESISKILFVFCVSVILTRVLNVRAASRADRASSPTRLSSQATFAFAFPALS